MRIGVLQFNPVLGAFDANIQACRRIIHKAKCTEALDLLVLPELALTGYAFTSALHIRPHLSKTHGPALSAAMEITKMVPSKMILMGYAEIAGQKAYNSCLAVDQNGQVLYNYRKTHLFETDESWASPGPDGFGLMTIPARGANVKPLTMALGICMDLNPLEFKAPFDAYEFGNFCVQNDADIIVVPMAWTKSEPSLDKADPHLQALKYWLLRLGPVNQLKKKKVLFIAADRTGSEGSTQYQGNSSVVLLDNGSWYTLGKLEYEEDMLVVDTTGIF